jgi:two-component system, NarL family, nitrate/nitrite response regulator NarL
MLTATGLGPTGPRPLRPPDHTVTRQDSGWLRASPDAIGAAQEDTGAVAPTTQVLVVDDHAGFRVFARAMLESAGFTVAEAATGAEATEAARTASPRLVLLDIQLPDVDGFEVARRIAAAGDSPVIVLTSTRDASDYGGKIAASPAAGFLPKDELSGAALRGFLAQDAP